MNLHFVPSQRLDLHHSLHYCCCCLEIHSSDQEKPIFLLVVDTEMMPFLPDKSCCKHESSWWVSVTNTDHCGSSCWNYCCCYCYRFYCGFVWFLDFVLEIMIFSCFKESGSCSGGDSRKDTKEMHGWIYCIPCTFIADQRQPHKLRFYLLECSIFPFYNKNLTNYFFKHKQLKKVV